MPTDARVEPPHEDLRAAPAAPPAAPIAATTEALAAAEGEAQAALAILLDVAAPVWAAGPHLGAGWAALARAAATRDGDELEDGVEPAEILRARAPRWLSPAAESALVASAGDARPQEADRGTFRTHARALVDTVRAAEAEIFGPDIRRREVRTWRRRAAMALLAAMPVIVLLAIFPPDYREGPWRAQYFGNRKHEGEPEIRRDGDLRFKWDDASPLSDLPEDGFSARWDTCLQLDAPHTIAFQLVSDDGSRLWIDGALVVDNWGTHGERSRGGKAELDAGLHHVRVDYFEAKHDAMVSLSASLRGERPDSLPVRLLHYPGDEVDDADPCAAVRAGLR